jgi:hypothetical protein
VYREVLSTGAVIPGRRTFELEVHLVPVLLGAGRRLFGAADAQRSELGLVRRLEGRDATHLRHRVLR